MATASQQVTGVEVVGVTDTSVELKWAAVATAANAKQGAAYRVEYAVHSMLYYSWTVVKDTTTNCSLTVDGLLAGTKYVARVSAAAGGADDASWGSPSELASFTTLTEEEDHARLKELLKKQTQAGAAGNGAGAGAGAGSGSGVGGEALQALQTKFEEQFRKLGTAQHDLSEERSKAKALSKDLAQAQARVLQLEASDNVAAASELADANARMGKVQSLLEAAVATQSSLEASLAAATERTAALEKELAAKEREVSALRLALSSIENHASRDEELLQRLDAATADVAAKAAQAATLKVELEASQAQVAELRAASSAAASGSASELAAAKALVAELTAKLEATEARCAALEEAAATVPRLREVNASLRESLAAETDKVAAAVNAAQEAKDEAAAAVASAQAEAKAAADAATKAAGTKDHYAELMAQGTARVEELSAAMAAVTLEKETAQAECARLSREKTSHTDALKAEADAKAALQAELEAAAAAAKAATEAGSAKAAEIEDLRAQVIALTEADAGNQAVIVELKDELRERAGAHEAVVAASKAEAREQAARVRQLQDEVSVLQTQLGTAGGAQQETIRQLRAQLEDRMAAVSRLEAEKATQLAGLREAQADQERLRAAEAATGTLKRTLGELQGQLESCRTENALQVARVQHLEELTGRLEASLAKVETERDEMTARHAAAMEQLGAARSAAEAAAKKADERRAPADVRNDTVKFFKDLDYQGKFLQKMVAAVQHLVDSMGFDEEQARMAVVQHPNNPEAQVNVLTRGDAAAAGEHK